MIQAINVVGRNFNYTKVNAQKFNLIIYKRSNCDTKTVVDIMEITIIRGKISMVVTPE